MKKKIIYTYIYAHQFLLSPELSPELGRKMELFLLVRVDIKCWGDVTKKRRGRLNVKIRMP